MTAHDNLRRTRAEKHLTQQQVADMRGIIVQIPFSRGIEKATRL